MSEAYHETPTNVVDITADGEHVSREVLFARKYVQDIDPFPELLVRLTRIYGPGVERDMLHQLVYWFGRPKMQNRWSAYKTADEWREERGLNKKQVNKGRKGFKADGVVQEYKGRYGKIHYRMDWLRLQRMLETGQRWPKDEVAHDDADPPFADPMIDPPRGSKESLTPLRGSGMIDPPRGGDPIQELTQKPTDIAYAEEFLSINSVLQTAPDAKNGAGARVNKNGKAPQAARREPSSTSSLIGTAGLNTFRVGEAKTILSGGHGADLLAQRHRWEVDAVVLMEHVARELGMRLSEDLRAEVKEAIRQLEDEGAPLDDFVEDF